MGSVNAGAGSANKPQVRAPLSTDGTSVYVPVAVNGKDSYPLFRKYSASGALQWSSNPSTVIPASGGFLLSGLSIANIGGRIRAFGGSSGHWIFGVDGGRGTKLWGSRNADSTMATPALADLYGIGKPQVIVSSDTTAEFTGDRNGGIFRIFTDNGYQICSATQLVSGSTYANSGYNNSSPAVAQIGGQPLIVFGSTGPRQYGSGGNQLVAYDSACRLKWASPDLGGRADTSPTFADVLGTGRPQIIAVVSVSYSGGRYPRVLVIDPATGGVLANTGSALSPYGATSIVYTQGSSIATADFNADGAQDMVVPAKQGKFLVLNGRTRAVMATIPTDIVVQNTPVITAGTHRVARHGRRLQRTWRQGQLLHVPHREARQQCMAEVRQQCQPDRPAGPPRRTLRPDSRIRHAGRRPHHHQLAGRLPRRDADRRQLRGLHRRRSTTLVDEHPDARVPPGGAR